MQNTLNSTILDLFEKEIKDVDGNGISYRKAIVELLLTGEPSDKSKFFILASYVAHITPESFAVEDRFDAEVLEHFKRYATTLVYGKIREFLLQKAKQEIKED